MQPEHFKLSRFSSQVVEALDKHLPKEQGALRVALMGIFQFLLHFAALTNREHDGEIRGAILEQLESGSRVLSEFAKGVREKLEPKLPLWAKGVIGAVFANLESLAEHTTTTLDDLIITILEGVMDYDEPENLIA